VRTRALERGSPAGPPTAGTLLYVPLLYWVGWLISRPLALLAPERVPSAQNLVA